MGCASKWAALFGLAGLVSRILDDNSQYHMSLNTWLSAVVPHSTKWTLCYRASEDNWNGATFHCKCDKKGPTVTIIKVKKNVFGGFIKSSWDGMFSKWPSQMSKRTAPLLPLHTHSPTPTPTPDELFRQLLQNQNIQCPSPLPHTPIPPSPPPPHAHMLHLYIVGISSFICEQIQATTLTWGGWVGLIGICWVIIIKKHLIVTSQQVFFYHCSIHLT